MWEGERSGREKRGGGREREEQRQRGRRSEEEEVPQEKRLKERTGCRSPLTPTPLTPDHLSLNDGSLSLFFTFPSSLVLLLSQTHLFWDATVVSHVAASTVEWVSEKERNPGSDTGSRSVTGEEEERSRRSYRDSLSQRERKRLSTKNASRDYGDRLVLFRFFHSVNEECYFEDWKGRRDDEGGKKKDDEQCGRGFGRR